MKSASGASKRIRITLRPALAASASEQQTNTLPHFGEMAARHLGVSAAGSALQSIGDMVRRLRDGAAAGGKGSHAIRTRRAAAAASASAAAHLRNLDILTVLDALAAPAPGEREVPYQSSLIDFSKKGLSERFETTLLALDRLAAGVAASAARTPRLPKGAPRRPKVLEIALDQLERVWWLHRQQQPTQSRNVGGFGALAEDILTASPCNYSNGTVRKAVAEYLRKPDRPAQVASTAPQTLPVVVGSAMILSDGHELADELAAQMRDTASPVTVCAIPDDGAAFDAQEDCTKGQLDLAIIVCLKEPSDANRTSRTQEDGTAMARDSCPARMPMRLHEAMTVLRPRVQPGGKVLVVMNDPRAVAAAGGPDAYLSATMSSAMVMLVSMWAQELGPHGVHVSALFPAWGRDEQGQPKRHSQLRVSAEVLRETLSRLGERQQGRLTDLYGQPVP